MQSEIDMDITDITAWTATRILLPESGPPPQNWSDGPLPSLPPE